MSATHLYFQLFDIDRVDYGFVILCNPFRVYNKTWLLTYHIDNVTCKLCINKFNKLKSKSYATKTN